MSYTDREVIETIRRISRGCYGHEGGGVTAQDIGSDLLDGTGSYRYVTELLALRRNLNSMARAGLLRKGKTLSGRVFYRAS